MILETDNWNNLQFLENNSNGVSNPRPKTSLGTSEANRVKSDSFNSDRKQINPSLGAIAVDSPRLDLKLNNALAYPSNFYFNGQSKV
jgi:hypothetical protein